MHDLEDVEDLGNVEDNGGGQDRQQVRHHDAERGGVLLAAWVAAVEDVRDAVDLVQHVGHHEHRHQRYASVVSHLPPDLGECEVGKFLLFWFDLLLLASFLFNWLRTNDRNTLCEIK